MRRRTTAGVLDGRVVAITGAGRGIGGATAVTLSRLGASVALGDLDLQRVEATAADLARPSLAVQLDVSDPASFAEFLERAETQLGPVDVLVNNAGIMPIGPFLDQPPTTTVRVLAVNVQGVITGCRIALQQMTARGRGHIVNVSSQAGRLGSSGAAVYCASKAAVITLSQALSDEYGDLGINVSCVIPGVVATELSAGFNASEGFIRAVQPEQVADAIADCLLRPRLFVHVPRLAGSGVTALSLLPAGLRRRAEQLAGTRHMALRAAESSDRAAYDARVAS
jgi:NAD(P)-dependent dehydrogenase (short-subunit alcohol dehydrogenase family)